MEIKRSVDLRTGPGSYYELLLRLKQGAVVKKLMDEEGWLQVVIDEYDGWMPDHPAYYGTNLEGEVSADSADVKSRMMSMFDEMSGDTNSGGAPYVSAAQVAAAVKGFARRYKTRRGGETRVDFSRSFDNRINAREYRRFRKDRVSDYHWDVLKDRFPVSNDTIPELSPATEQMGWAIAGVIAENGLVENYELQKYLNYVALVVTESSHRYEIPVQVHILDTNDVVGYSTPNGIIFVSRGALSLMENEAEFAFFVGHELAHVVMQHGVQEIRGRRVRINSDKTFGELEKELNYDERSDDKYVQISRELTEWTDQVYEYIVSDKLESYEHQADYWGMVYAYRAGYNPGAAIDFLNRFKKNVGDFETQIGELKWQGTDVDDRLKRCANTWMGLYTIPDQDMEHRQEFQQMKKGL